MKHRVKIFLVATSAIWVIFWVFAFVAAQITSAQSPNPIPSQAIAAQWDIFPLGSTQFDSLNTPNGFVCVDTATNTLKPVLTSGDDTYFDGSMVCTSPDHIDWAPSRAFAYGAKVKPDDINGKYGLMGQYDSELERAWHLQFEGNGYVICAIRDESTARLATPPIDGGNANVLKPRTAFPNDGLAHHIGCNYKANVDGSYTAEIRIDGVLKDTRTASLPGFVLGMVNIDEPAIIGSFRHNGDYIESFSGWMTGGACGPFITNKFLTDQEWLEVADCD